MPWKASPVMEERLRFVARLLDGEATTDVCRDFGVSRKTGYKIFDRYKEHGLEALSDRSRRPVRYANQGPQIHDGGGQPAQRLRPSFGDRRPMSREGRRTARSMAANLMIGRPARFCGTVGLDQLIGGPPLGQSLTVDLTKGSTCGTSFAWRASRAR
jgi:transposase-like protein